MLDLVQIVGFDWDNGNLSKRSLKNSVLPTEAEQVFTDPRLTIADDVKHSQRDVRYQAIGGTADGRLLHVTFTLRHNGTKIRVISARDVNSKERVSYGQEP